MIQKANEKDLPKIKFFIEKLAEYEKMSDQVVVTEELLKEWLFDKKIAEVFIAKEEGESVGFALYFYSYSTFLGRGGIWLEDLFVLPDYRGRGNGVALLSAVAKEAKKSGCGRLEWSCLDWNQPSIDFYLSLGAERMDGWTTYRMTGEMLQSLADRT